MNLPNCELGIFWKLEFDPTSSNWLIVIAFDSEALLQAVDTLGCVL
jgi:hypothetical protein